MAKASIPQESLYPGLEGAELRGIYTGYAITLDPGEDPSQDAFEKGINTEHTWPQSKGAEDEPAKSDMHALYPMKDNVNSSRSNHPYAEIPDAETNGWYRLDESRSNRCGVSSPKLASKRRNDIPFSDTPGLAPVQFILPSTMWL